MTQKLILIALFLPLLGLNNLCSQTPKRPPGRIVIDDICTIRESDLAWSQSDNLPMLFFPSAANQRTLTIPFTRSDCNYFDMNITVQLADGRWYESSNYISVLHDTETWCYVDSLSTGPLYLMDTRAEQYYAGLDLPDETVVNSINFTLGAQPLYPGYPSLSPSEITNSYGELMIYEVRPTTDAVQFKFAKNVVSAEIDLKYYRECLPEDAIKAKTTAPEALTLNSVASGEATFVSYTVHQPSDISLEIVDKLGHLKSRSFVDKRHDAGAYTRELDTGSLGQDVYFLIVRSSDGRVLSKSFFRP
jgi:hypothetical protein